MTLTNLNKAPFPYFGGKADAAPLIWQALGDVAHYVEPFCGSLAVLLRRPHEANRTYYSETVNDLDGLLCNAWRAIQFDPDATAEAASWPVCENDMHAKHLAIVEWLHAPRRQDWLAADMTHYDAQIAGWWIWGMSCWIGSGFASGNGPWRNVDGYLTKAGRPGIERKLPHMGDNGQGVNRPQGRELGLADANDYHPMTMPEVRRWFAYLSARLRHVRILNGDWTRACTPSVVATLPVRKGDGYAGVLLDPPYGDVRADGLYTHDSLTVAEDVRRWCVANGTKTNYRIVLCGFSGEGHEALCDHGWRELPWFKGGWLKGGMANQTGATQQHRERLWLSPACLRTSAEAGGLPMDDLWGDEDE